MLFSELARFAHAFNLLLLECRESDDDSFRLAVGERDRQRKKTEAGVGDVRVPSCESKKGEERTSYGKPHTIPAVGVRSDMRPLGEDGGGW